MRRKYLGLFSVLLVLNFAYCQQEFVDGYEPDSEEILGDDDVATVENVDEEIVYESPKYDASKFHFVDHFDDIEKSEKSWTRSQAKKDDIAEEIAKYDGVWKFESPQRIVWKDDIGLVLKSKAKHAAISSPLKKPFKFEDKPLVVQYEVTMQEGQECGGSYIKLLSSGKNTEDLKKFNDKTPYTIMFGPDKCGNDIKLHFIFRHVNPINGSIEEKHCRKPKERLEEPFKDKLPHLYQLIVKPDNTFQISVDHKVINEGSLLNDFNPAVNPPSEIDDPTDKKPEGWDEREKIPDPDAEKPSDWDEDAPPQIPDPSAAKPEGWLDDEPEMIPDANALKPEDWDTEIDGEWEAPLVDNPVCEKAVGCGPWKAPLVQNKEFKGKWRAPLIDNPNYLGKWKPRRIPNPDFFEDLNPFAMTAISAVGIELWSMSSDILFDNLIITDDIEVAKDFSSKTFDIKRKYIDKESETFLNKMMQYLYENPWVWQISIVLLGTPLVFSLYRLISGSKKDSAENKKTDEVTPDDDNEEKKDNQTHADKESKKPSSPKAKKADLEVKSTPDQTPPNSAASSEEEEQEELVVEREEEAGKQNSEAAQETEERTTPPAAEGTRKRRPRKD
ncbi:calnexin [Eupeodes corollae]|uniref:calnexin n=1 Tax=Eupeodes corollae TaxID=290404 RepID=UPI002490936E|nr:calnexin [Eupeodes corollae]XP_055918788.1 calnexin [Eupeodes corollae]